MGRRRTGDADRMEREILSAEAFERAVADLLHEEAERRRPDLRGPRGNPAVRAGEPERSLAELDRVL